MKKVLFFVFISLLLFGEAYGQDIYTYDNSTAGLPVFVDPLLATATPLTPIGTGATTPCTWGFSGITGFTGVAYTTAGPCIQVTLTATAGYTITANGFTAGLRRSTTGPVLARMAYSTDGTSWTDQGIDHLPLDAGCATSTAGTTFAGWSTFSVTNPTLYFRIYPFNASGVGGTIQIYGLHIIGNVHLACTTPTITVTPASSAICSGGSGAALTGLGAGVGGTYSWAPSAGLSATTGAIVTANPGITTVYTVTGTVPGGCFNTAASTVTVNPSPSTSISASGPLAFCLGGSVTLTAASGAGYIYQWYNGPALISGATTISYTAAASGTYTARVTNTLGCTSASVPSVVFVSPFPVISVSPASAVICDGSSVSLTATGAGPGGVYSWTPGAGLSSMMGATVSASPSATIAYTVTGTNTTGCSGSATRTVSVNVAPPATVTTSGATTFCSGNNVILFAPTGYLYQWFNGATAIPGATNALYTATATGNYTVVVTAFGCSRTSAVTTVTVSPLPSATVSSSGPVTFCSPGSVTLNAATAPGNSYQWFRGTGTVVSGAVSASYTASATDNYYVRVTGANGCHSYSPFIRVTAVTTPYITTASGSNLCSGSGASLTVNAGGASSGVSYQWKLNATVISGATTTVHHPSVSGAYSCEVTVTGSCTFTTAPVTISVLPAPAPVLNFSGGVLSVSNTYVTYQWYVGASPVSGATSHSYRPVANGAYRVKVTDANGCTGYSIFRFFTVGIEDLNEQKIKIYPNPATSMVYIGSPVPVRAVISGMEGRILSDKADATELDLSNMPSGVYIVTIYGKDGERLLTQKMVKE
jgi:hypothetical protein